MAEGMDGAREDDGNIRLNPFEQPPVLQALFEQLSLEDFSKCRLVNKLWYEESLSAWRSNVTLKFGREGIVSTREDGSKRTTSVGEFLDLWEAGDWGSCPFRKFYLHSWNFEAEDWEQQRFLELVGPHVTSLTLEKCKFVERDHFRAIIYQAFSKLQFLKFESYCEVDNIYWYEFTEDILVYKEPAFGVHGLQSLDICGFHPHSMMDMLSHFHKLKSLSLRTNEKHYKHLLETIKLIRSQDQTKLPLENFDVNFGLYLGDGKRSASIELLKLNDQLNLHLQRLDIWSGRKRDDDCNFDGGNVIRDIIQNHSSTLKQLAYYGDDRQGFFGSFPFGFHLKQLEVLSLAGDSPDNLNYVLCTPNLRVLYIWNNRGLLSIPESDNLFSNSPQLDIGSYTLPSLTNLYLELPVSVRNLEKLMKWTPNLEQLSWLKLDDVKFALVCKNWKNLKKLKDCGTELTDEGVIRIGNPHEAGEDEEAQSGPNIIKLKYLTIFETRSSKLTSASVHGFLKLANLEKLRLGRSTKLDDEAKAALERQKIELSFTYNVFS